MPAINSRKIIPIAHNSFVKHLKQLNILLICYMCHKPLQRNAFVRISVTCHCYRTYLPQQFFFFLIYNIIFKQFGVTIYLEKSKRFLLFCKI